MKRGVSILLLLTMLLGILPVGIPAVTASETGIPYAVEGGNIYFDKETQTITDADESITAANIPEQIDGVAVTAIGTAAFSTCTELTNISIPEGVETIGQSAFEDCAKLTSITTPDSLTLIDWFAFRFCSSLESISISAGVCEIGNSAFEECVSLAGIWVDEANEVYSSDASGVLFNKAKTEIIRCPYAYSGSYTVPDTVTFIDYPFSYCTGLTDLIVSDSVRYINMQTFYGCTALTGIWVDEANESYSNDDCGVLFNKDKTSLLKCPNGYSGSYAIPNSVTVIDEKAFHECCNLTDVTIPEGVTSINNHAFYNCTSLKKVAIPNSVTVIGEFAFSGCTGLTEINIPASVTSIGSGAFWFCDSLTGIWVDKANEFYSSDASGVLFNKDKTTLIQCPIPYSGKVYPS